MKKKSPVKKGNKRLYDVGGSLTSRGINANNFDLNALMLNQGQVSPELAGMNNTLSSTGTGNLLGSTGIGGGPMAIAGMGLKGVSAMSDNIAFAGKSDQEIADFYSGNYNSGKQYDLTKANMDMVGSAVSGDIGGAVAGIGDMFNTFQDRKSDIEDASGFSKGEQNKLKAYNVIDTIAPTLGGLGLGLQALTGTSSTKKKFDQQMSNTYDLEKRATAINERDSKLGINGQIAFKELGGDLNTEPSIDTNVEKLNPSLKLISFDEGKTHKNSRIGGIPQGINQETGEVNMVEEGETRFGEYIFSNKLKLKDRDVEGLGAALKGMTFANASKKLYTEVKERPNDPIAKRTWVNSVSKLIAGNESAKA